jgi:hypothetical protein
MADKPHLRVSDQDREQAASEIREHYAAGRLDSAEFEERVQAAYDARTQRELNAISADLPALPPKPPTTTELIRQTVSSTSLVGNAGAAGTLFLVCTGIWAITGAGGSFWPKWVLVFMLVSVARGIRRDQRRARRANRRRGGWGGGRGYSYRYEYRYGDSKHEHKG